MRYSTLSCGSPIVAGLVDLHKKHILKYFLLREVRIKYCAGILEWGGGRYFSWGKEDRKNGNWKGFTEERESNSLKNENVGLKDIQG